jgi:hypothetical protein
MNGPRFVHFAGNQLGLAHGNPLIFVQIFCSDGCRRVTKEFAAGSWPPEKSKELPPAARPNQPPPNDP